MFSLLLVLVDLVRPDLLRETGFVSWIFIVEAIVIYICQDFYATVKHKFSMKNMLIICFCGGYVVFGVMKTWMGLNLPNWCGILFGAFGGIYLFFCPMALLLLSVLFDYIGWMPFSLDIAILTRNPWFYIFGILGFLKGLFYAKVVWNSLKRVGKKPPPPPKKGNMVVNYTHEP